MIANFFNKTKPVHTVILIALLLIYYMSAIFLRNSEAFSLLFMLEKIGFFLCLILLLLIINFIVNKNDLTQGNSYSFLLVVFLLGIFFEGMFVKNLLFANMVLLLAFRKIYSLHSGLNTKQKLFDAGLWIGVSTLFYSWSLLFMILIYTAVVVYKKQTVKNIFIPMVGFLAPIFIYFTYCLYFDALAVFYRKFTFDYGLVFNSYNQLKLLIPISFLLAILIWSTITLTPKILLVNNNFKLAWKVIINHLLVAVIIILLSPIKKGAEFFFLVFPSALIIANFIQKSESVVFKNLFLYLFFMISVTVYFL